MNDYLSETSLATSAADSSNERKRPERACPTIFAAQILAGRWALAQKEPVVVDFHQIELLGAC